MPGKIPIDMMNYSSKELKYLRENRFLLRKLAKETHFNLKEVQALALIHYKICMKRGKILAILLRDILHAGLDITEHLRHLSVDRIYSVINQQNSFGSGISIGDWVRGFSVLLRGTLEEKIDFAYKVYDLTMMSSIKRQQILRNMRGCIIEVGSDEEIDEVFREFVNLILKTFDVNRDGKICEEDFKSVIMNKNELLLECMGPIFPSRDFQYAFLTTFTNNIGDF